jgi:hypothetical protein
MNLVAQEFVLCQSGQASEPLARALLLSEPGRLGTGAPGSLARKSVECKGVVEHLVTALELPVRARQRLGRWRSESSRSTSRRWAEGSTSSGSAGIRDAIGERAGPRVDSTLEARIRRKFVRAARTIVLDYDRTLREFECTRTLAQPAGEFARSSEISRRSPRPTSTSSADEGAVTSSNGLVGCRCISAPSTDISLALRRGVAHNLQISI